MMEPCGCRVYRPTEAYVPRITYCPLHAAAPETAADLDSLLKDYDKLKVVLEEAKLVDNWLWHGYDAPYPRKAELRAAIAKAKGENDG